MSSTSVILNIIVYQEHVVEENVKIQNTDQTKDHIPQTYTAVGKYSNRQNIPLNLIQKLPDYRVESK